MEVGISMRLWMLNHVMILVFSLNGSSKILVLVYLCTKLWQMHHLKLVMTKLS